jgi:hypothetical protein
LLANPPALPVLTSLSILATTTNHLFGKEQYNARNPLGISRRPLVPPHVLGPSAHHHGFAALTSTAALRVDSGVGMAKKLNGYDPHPVEMKDKLLAEKRTVKGATKPHSSPNAKGCSENDGNEHVYAHVLVIVTWPASEDRPDREYRYWGPCIGCGHINRSRSAWKKEPTGDPDQVIKRRMPARGSIFAYLYGHDRF